MLEKNDETTETKQRKEITHWGEKACRQGDI